jgi:uncharacterized paraquat-inducible protein A
MKLVANWSAVLRHAWSVRFILASLLLSVLAAVLPMVAPYLTANPWVAALITGLAALADGVAFVARIVAQARLQGTEIAWDGGEEK